MKIPLKILKRNGPPIFMRTEITQRPKYFFDIVGRGEPYKFKNKFFNTNQPPQNVEFYYRDDTTLSNI